MHATAQLLNGICLYALYPASSLVSTLQQTEPKAALLKSQLSLAADTTAAIDASREAFRPIAAHGVACFDVVSRLVGLNPMYAFSLPWFKALFSTSLLCEDSVTGCGDGTLVDGMDDAAHALRSCMQRLR
jgi:hypothetical protein